MKKNLFIKVFSVTVLCFLASYLCAAAAGLNQKDSYPVAVVEKYSGSFNQETGPAVELKRTFYVQGIKVVDVSTVYKDVIFKMVDQPSIEVRYYASSSNPKIDPEKDFETEVQGDQLKIKTDLKKADKSFFSINESFDRHGEIVVTMPKTIKTLVLKTVSGNIVIPNTSVDDLKIETVSGDVSIEKTEIAKAKISTISGNIVSSGTIDELNGKTISGNIDIEVKSEAPKLDVNSTSGDTTIYFHNKPDIAVDFSSISGSVNVDASFNTLESASKSAKFKMGGGRGAVNVRTISGDVTLAKK